MKNFNLSKIILQGCFFVFIISVLFKTYIASVYSIKSELLVDANLEIATLEKDIIELQEKIADVSSFNYLQNHANSLGYVKNPNNLLSIKVTTVVADAFVPKE